MIRWLWTKWVSWCLTSGVDISTYYAASYACANCHHIRRNKTGLHGAAFSYCTAAPKARDGFIPYNFCCTERKDLRWVGNCGPSARNFQPKKRFRKVFGIRPKKIIENALITGPADPSRPMRVVGTLIVRYPPRGDIAIYLTMNGEHRQVLWAPPGFDLMKKLPQAANRVIRWIVGGVLDDDAVMHDETLRKEYAKIVLRELDHADSG